MRRLFLKFSLIFLMLGCSESNQETIEEETMEEAIVIEENVAPTIADQTFDIIENPEKPSIVGRVVANDLDGDPIFFAFVDESFRGLEIDKVTGDVTIPVSSNLVFDFETITSYTFEVYVSDGKSQDTAELTFNISDIDDGLLTDIEKRTVNSFIVQVQYGNIENGVYKREENAKLFFSGLVTNNLVGITEIVAEEYNEMFTDGFEISTVNDSLSANVYVHSSTIEELAEKWSDFYQVALDNPGLGGIAGGNRIWIADYAQNTGTIKHEMGHMIGLAHSPLSECNTISNNSIMCGGVGNAGTFFTEVDSGVITSLYNPKMSIGLSGVAVEELLTELLLSNR